MRSRVRTLLPTVFFAVSIFLASSLLSPSRAHADFVSIWGQIHGGYLTGTSDRFEEGSQPFGGFAAGLSLAIIDVFIDVRMDDFDLEKAGMWNQVGLGASFGLPLPYISLTFGARLAYLYAQFSEDARKAYESKALDGERSGEPSQKGLNASVVAMADIELIGPLMFNITGDLGYHVLLPDPAELNGINFSVLGGLKLKFGF